MSVVNAFVGFGGLYWLELIGGMLLAVHRVLQRMVLVRGFDSSLEVVKLDCPLILCRISMTVEQIALLSLPSII